tara:strand:+ start:164 stop:736 length:573 start_codon:yes stop_codon:yes gene_type:complete
MQYFKKGCRNCNQSNGMQGVIADFENDLDYYKNLTDFEISKRISKTLKKNRQNCEFCGANNYDISNIKIDDHQIFNLQDLKDKHKEKGSYIFVYNIFKRNNEAQVNVDNGDTYPNTYEDTTEFEKKCRSEIQNLIDSYSNNDCIHHPDGILYLCFTANENEFKLQKFRHSGFSKTALINLTDNIGKNPFD